jgi:hypothetical protein
MEAICFSETSVISQKIVLFITTAVKTSNPTLLHLMEFNPNFTYMLQSATAESNVYCKYTETIFFKVRHTD